MTDPPGMVEVAMVECPDGVARSTEVVVITGRAGRHRLELRPGGVAAVVAVEDGPHLDVCWTVMVDETSTIVLATPSKRATFRIPTAAPLL